LVIIACVNDPRKLKAYLEYGPIVSWQRMGNDEIPSVAMDQAEGYKLALWSIWFREDTPELQMHLAGLKV
ncbi:hypothetical protein ABWV16_24075, partial [Bacillus velezensis]